MPTEKTGNYQSSLKGGGVPPYWQNANIFPVFSYEGFPKCPVTMVVYLLLNTAEIQRHPIQ